VTDVGQLDAAARELRAAFPDPWLRHYSVKANDVPAIVGRLAADTGPGGLGANVVSRGEWRIAAAAGIPNERITLEGIGKTDADLRAAVAAARADAPVRWVAVESADEASALARMAAAAGIELDVLARLNPDVSPETDPGLAVGVGGSKFGMTETELTGLVERGPDGPLRWRGIHLHVGSQLGAVDAWRDAVRRGLAVLALVRGTLPEFDTLDLGGGFPVAPRGVASPSPARFARELPDLLAATPDDRRPARLAIEPGRFLVARAGSLLARVLHVRERGEVPLVVIDAGMTELIRPALYGARHPIVALTSLGRPIDPESVTELRRTRVDGPICESTDMLGDHELPTLRRGDLVAIRDAGAYAAAQSSTYNGRPRPAQVLVEANGSLTLARARGRIGA
jgi:diaminopimelate decarboxylase